MANPPKIALVTGCNRGLGLETSRQLAAQGVTVIMTARNLDKLQQNAQSMPGEVALQALDVTDAAQVEKLAGWIQSQFGRLDILVNNAGIFPDGMPGEDMPSALKVPLDMVRKAMETNLYAPLRLCQTFIPWMTRQNYGRVVNISSGMGQLSEMNGCCPAYRASKTALNAVTRIFADELKGSNVLINSCCPGWVRTDMGGPQATRDLPEGADTIVWLATLPDGGPSGGFFRDRQPIAW
jgi:NAD(P)-dependent dehydrogenase (short-subunit alcohol dehydrogenase family)